MKQTIFALTIVTLAAMTSCNNGSGLGGGTQQMNPTQAQQAAPATPAPAVDTTATAAAAPAPAATVSPAALPAPITDFLKKHFPQATVSYVETDNEFGGVEYDVTLSDGTEVDFDPANQWDNVDCHMRPVPAALVPAAIANYVKANFQGQMITKINKKPTGFEIDLSNGMELNFNQSGQFLGMDD
ncbi:MAG: PepSY-like domain-containing protein [Muribaculaceae bacterium]|nr:PepSY-like domain-containing protein [Muribaculaceae bacterium]